jgi:tetratricopeptide (TPR) repeat protein
VKTGQYEQARGNFLTLMDMEESKADAELNGICYTNLGICLLNLGDTLGAESYQNQALDVMDISGEEIGKADVYVNLAEIYLAKKDRKAAFDVLGKALAISQKNNYNEGLINAWRSLSAYYAFTKEYERAYLYLSKCDSASAKNNTSLREGLIADDLETADIAPEKQEVSFFSAANAWLFLLIAALVLLLIVIFKQFKHEQKEQEG